MRSNMFIFKKINCLALVTFVFITNSIAQLSFKRIPANWEVVLPYHVMAIAVSPKTSSVFALVNNIGIMRSNTLGAIWDTVFAIPTYYPILHRTLIADESGTLYLGTPDGELYKGTNDGTQWEKIATLPNQIFSVLASRNGSIFVAAGALYYSSDGGKNWNYKQEEWFNDCYSITETPRGQIIAASPYNRNIVRSLMGEKAGRLILGVSQELFALI